MGCADNSVVCVSIPASWMCFMWHKQLLMLGHAGGLGFCRTSCPEFVTSHAITWSSLLSCLSLLWSISHTTSQRVLRLFCLLFIPCIGTRTAFSHKHSRGFYDTFSRTGDVRFVWAWKWQDRATLMNLGIVFDPLFFF